MSLLNPSLIVFVKILKNEGNVQGSVREGVFSLLILCQILTGRWPNINTFFAKPRHSIVKICYILAFLRDCTRLGNRTTQQNTPCLTLHSKMAGKFTRPVKRPAVAVVEQGMHKSLSPQFNGTRTQWSGHSVTATATIIHITFPWLLPGEDTFRLPSATSGGTTAGKERKGLPNCSGFWKEKEGRLEEEGRRAQVARKNN